jgi:glucose-6-phosphate-specific signal transduction histidine kinase
LGAVVLGFLLLLRAVGWWPGDPFVWPLVIAAAGLALVWSRPGANLPATPVRGFEHLPPAASQALSTLFGTRRRSWVRFVGGIVLVLGGIAAFSASVGTWETLRSVAFGTIVVGLGIALAFGPAIGRLVTELTNERRERIRVAERADIAAHLHDSVLQTLALIQRRADDPHQVVSLARAQERELRSWLFDGKAPGSLDGRATTVSDGIRLIQQEIEAQHGIVVDAISVGECELDEDLGALLAAAREATVNAAKWSGAGAVSLFAEVEPTAVSVFVRDRGRGFDPAAVPADRKGLAESVRARMERRGGSATIRSTLGEGTEVVLTMPRTAGQREPSPAT